MAVLSTQSDVVFENVSGRIAACPTSVMNGWDSYVPLTLTLPKNNSEIRYFVTCLKKLEKDNGLWRNPIEQINTYGYDAKYQLK